MMLRMHRIDGLNHIPLPRRSTTWSAGYDIFCPKEVIIKPQENSFVKLGISWAPELLPQGGFFAKVFEKSGLALKSCFATYAGVIDVDYREEWGLICSNRSHENTLLIGEGKAICQFVLLPFLVADDLQNLDVLRVGGYGSTDKAA